MSNEKLKSFTKLKVLAGLQEDNYALNSLYENAELFESEDYPVLDGKVGPFKTKDGEIKYFDLKENKIVEGKKKDHDGDGDVDSDDYLAAKDKAIKKAKAEKEDVKESVACAQDVKECPDGSFVNRDADNGCEFTEKLDENAVDATAVTSLENIDDEDYQNEKMGVDTARETKVPFPSEIRKSIDNRIKELKDAIDLYDEKGYNDGSLKPNAISVLEKIKEKLELENYEGFRQAQMHFQRLMSPITSLLPSRLINFLATGDQKENTTVMKEVE